MGVFSNLFGGGAGYSNPGPSAVSSAQVTNEGFELQKPFIQDIFETAQAETYDIADDGTKTLRGYEEFLGPRLADFSTEQTEALSGLAGLGRQGLAGTSLAASPQYFQQAKDAVTQGQRQFTSADADRLMNPFLDEVIDIQQREARRSFERDVAPKLDAEAVAAGSFGGSRAGLMQAEAERNLQQRLDDISAKGRLTAFEQAQKAFEQEQGRQFQGAQLATALGTEAPAQAARELGLLSSAGEVQQAQEQKALDLAEAEFIRQRDFPMRQLQEYQSLVRGFPFNPSTFEVGSKYQAQPTFGQQLLGGLGTAAGLFGAFGGFSPGKKAGGQVVSRKSGGTIQGGLAGLERHQNINPTSLSNKIGMGIPQVRIPTRPNVNFNTLSVRGLAKDMLPSRITSKSPDLKARNEYLNLLHENAKKVAAKRTELANPTTEQIDYRTILEERGQGFDELRETVTEESELDVETGRRNKWMALADLGLEIMSANPEGGNVVTVAGRAAKETGFTKKIINAAKQERDAAKEMREKLSKIDDKEIANRALLSGISKEEEKDKLTAEINNLKDTELLAKEGISQQEKMLGQIRNVEADTREVAKLLVEDKNAQARLQKELNAASDDDLKTTEWKVIAGEVAKANNFVFDPEKNTFRSGNKILQSTDPAFATIQIEIMDTIREGKSTGKVPKMQIQIARNTFKRVVPGTDKISAKEIDGLLSVINGPLGEQNVDKFIKIHPNVKKEDLMKLRSGYRP
jgi:hypothetical protein